MLRALQCRLATPRVVFRMCDMEALLIQSRRRQLGILSRLRPGGGHAMQSPVQPGS